MKHQCECHKPFPSKKIVSREYRDVCEAGGGFSQWFECCCGMCGRVWTERFGA